MSDKNEWVQEVITGQPVNRTQLRLGRSMTLSVHAFSGRPGFRAYVNGARVEGAVWDTLQDAQAGCEMLAIAILEESLAALKDRSRPPRPPPPPEEPLGG